MVVSNRNLVDSESVSECDGCIEKSVIAIIADPIRSRMRLIYPVASRNDLALFGADEVAGRRASTGDDVAGALLSR